MDKMDAVLALMKLEEVWDALWFVGVWDAGPYPPRRGKNLPVASMYPR